MFNELFNATINKNIDEESKAKMRAYIDSMNSMNIVKAEELDAMLRASKLVIDPPKDKGDDSERVSVDIRLTSVYSDMHSDKIKVGSSNEK